MRLDFQNSAVTHSYQIPEPHCRLHDRTKKTNETTNTLRSDRVFVLSQETITVTPISCQPTSRCGPCSRPPRGNRSIFPTLRNSYKHRAVKGAFSLTSFENASSAEVLRSKKWHIPSVHTLSAQPRAVASARNRARRSLFAFKKFKTL